MMAEPRNARGLAYRHWPEKDRQMWQRLTRPGDVFDEGGPLSHARPSSLEASRNAYGFFLRHLVRTGVDLEAGTPDQRATLDQLRSYAASIEGLAPRTQAGYFAGLYGVLHAAYPNADWEHLNAAKRALHRRANAAGGTRSAAQIPSSDVLLDLGLGMIMTAQSELDRDNAACALWRDGLMIAFLAAHPVRIRNFGMLQIGVSLLTSSRGFQVTIPGEASKNHRPFDFSVAPMIAEELALYLEACRPVFPGGEDPTRGMLWLASHGKPWGYKQIGRRISACTEDLLGIRVTPHQFRHAAATTLALEGDGKARLSKALLTHATPDLADRVYDRSQQYDFSCRYVELVDKLKRDARQSERSAKCGQ